MRISRALSVVVAVVYLALALSMGAYAFYWCIMFLALPLACIWFSDELGSYTGRFRGHLITTETPGVLVAAGGWLVLLLPVIIWLILHFSGS
jgi:hypothetical protein